MAEAEQCRAPARWRRSWPGREDDLVCDGHAKDSEELAGACGFAVRLEPITRRAPCACTAGRLQRVHVRRIPDEESMGNETLRDEDRAIREAILNLGREERLDLWAWLTDFFVAPGIHQEAVDRGWWEDLMEADLMAPDTAAAFRVAFLYTKNALIASEVFEGGEALRHGDPPDEHLPDRSNFEVELADAVVRVFDLAGYLERPVGQALAEKVRYNRTRGQKHGGKKV